MRNTGIIKQSFKTFLVQTSQSAKDYGTQATKDKEVIRTLK
jgi:hypothetical protein